MRPLWRFPAPTLLSNDNPSDAGLKDDLIRHTFGQVSGLGNRTAHKVAARLSVGAGALVILSERIRDRGRHTSDIPSPMIAGTCHTRWAK